MPNATLKIFYGPPGSGKTFHVVREAVQILDKGLPKTAGGTVDDDEVNRRYRELAAAGHIWFVTFHPSYSYEDFVEGFRPVEIPASGQIGYSVIDGPFKLACKACRPTTRPLQPGDEVSSMKGDAYRVMHVGPETIRVAVHSKDADAVITDGPAILPVDRYVLDLVHQAALTDMAFSIGGENMYDLARFNIQPNDPYLDPPSVADEETPTSRKGKNIRKCVARKTRVNTTFWASLPHYGAVYRRLYGEGPRVQNVVLIIDEINRADLSRVMGELVTLLEPVKRLGEAEALTVRLPYSKEPFGVPAELSILGTMNTTDRSLAVMDYAFRRRFDFVEIPPNPTLCPTNYGGIDVRSFLKQVNERIEFLRSRDHRIGHAELMPHKLEAIKKDRFAAQSDAEARAFAWVLRHKILPLLLEYFPEDWRRAHAVLGGNHLLTTVLPSSRLTALIGDGADREAVASFSLPDFWDPESACWSSGDFLAALTIGNDNVVIPALSI